MLRIFLEQLAFISTLASLVAALLWPHLKPLLDWIWFRIAGSLLTEKQQEQTNDPAWSNRLERKQNNVPEHPRLNGDSSATTTTITGQRRKPFVRVSLMEMQCKSNLIIIA